MTRKTVVHVCAIDQSEMAPLVVEHALAEAHHLDDVDTHFMTVVKSAHKLFQRGDLKQEDIDVIHETMRGLVIDTLPAFVSANKSSKRNISFHVRSGIAHEQIIELAFETRADRIIIGRHSSDAYRTSPGGVSEAVVREGPCTVQVVAVADYDRSEQKEQCDACAKVRVESKGERWFCDTHNDGRIPRLSRYVGSSSQTPGWGIF